MVMSLEKDFQYFLSNREELLKKHEGKWLVIKGEKVIGVFDDQMKAIEETSKAEELGTFLVQKCDRSKESYSQTFHSRVAICS